jgi:thiamine biosynthesis lipoprotein
MLRRARPLLGTFVEIRLAAPDEAAAECALRAGFAAVARVQRLMNYHDAGSDVSRVNRLAARRPVAVHPWTAAVLHRAARLHRESGGLFDITIAPTLARGGWLPRCRPRRADPRATAADIEILPGRRVRFRKPLAVDLGGIAKGYAVDRAVSVLRRAGALSGTVNAGGDLRVFGPAANRCSFARPDRRAGSFRSRRCASPPSPPPPAIFRRAASAAAIARPSSTRGRAPP